MFTWAVSSSIGSWLHSAAGICCHQNLSVGSVGRHHALDLCCHDGCDLTLQLWCRLCYLRKELFVFTLTVHNGNWRIWLSWSGSCVRTPGLVVWLSPPPVSWPQVSLDKTQNLSHWCFKGAAGPQVIYCSFSSSISPTEIGPPHRIRLLFCSTLTASFVLLILKGWIFIFLHPGNSDEFLFP